MLSLEIQLNYQFAKCYNKCKSHECQFVQTIIMVVSSNPMSPVGTNVKNVHKGDLLSNEWLLHRNKIVDDCNIIRELIGVCENYKSIIVLTMCYVDFMIEGMCIKYVMYNSCKMFYTIFLLCVNKERILYIYQKIPTHPCFTLKWISSLLFSWVNMTNK